MSGLSAPTGTPAEMLGVPGLETRQVDAQRLTIRAADDGGERGTFEGIACPFDTEDSYGTMFAPGCFSRGDSNLEGDLYAYLWMHSPWDPVGTFRAEERADGLWISGEWDATPAGQEARGRALSGSAPELSVGFLAMTIDPDNQDRFMQVRLVEVSQVTRRYGAVPGAQLTEARHKLPRHGDASAMLRHRERQARAAVAALRLSSL